MPINDAVQLLALPEHDMVSVTLSAEDDEIFQLGERINARWDMAYMNGYNWEALIHAYVRTRDPELEAKIEPDPEAGMYAGTMAHSPDNLKQMARFEALILELLADEAALFAFIEANDIAWD